MFYAVFDELTALTEIYDIRRYQATIGTYYNLRELSMVDLRWIFNTLFRLFDKRNRHSRMSLLFIRRSTYEPTK